MSNEAKQLSNPFSTGGGGHNFENHVQGLFVVLLLTGGVVPCIKPAPIKQIKLQGKYAGYETDDFIAFVEDGNGGNKAKLLAQIKRSVSITENDPVFADVIQAAWSDFRSNLFDRETDAFALITGPLSAHDIDNARTILELARHSASAQEFLDKVNLAKFSSDAQRAKLQAFRSRLKTANNETDVGDEQLWQFLKRFHLLGYDLDMKSGVTISLLHSHMTQFNCGDIVAIWAKIAKEVESFNQNAGTITLDTISSEIRGAFCERSPLTHIPAELLKATQAPQPVEFTKGEVPNVLAIAALVGSWNDKQPGDMEVIKKLIEGK
jgi:hypothetical protein